MMAICPENGKLIINKHHLTMTQSHMTCHINMIRNLPEGDITREKQSKHQNCLQGNKRVIQINTEQYNSHLLQETKDIEQKTLILINLMTTIFLRNEELTLDSLHYLTVSESHFNLFEVYDISCLNTYNFSIKDCEVYIVFVFYDDIV